MLTNFRKTLQKIRGKNSESGFTLIEILVAISLMAIVATIATMTVINATQANDKFVRGTMNQSQLLDSISIVTRDISLSNQIIAAGKDYLVMNTVENGVAYKTSVFAWKPGKTLAFSGVTTSKLPAQSSIIEYKVRNGDTVNPQVKTLVDGYNPQDSTTPIFRYFAEDNTEFTIMPIPADQLNDVKRIQIHFLSYIDGRDVPMELETSAIPRSGQTLPGITADGVNIIPQTPILRGTLTPGTTTAKLMWSNIAGATSYTLSRENDKQTTSPQVTTTTPNTNFDDPNLTWGETYVYSVIASGPGGVSAPSNKVSLTVVPDKEFFINIDPNRKAPIANYTVARDLTNQLAWQPLNGATGYVLYRGGVEIYRGPATTFGDTGRNYGDVTTYTVLAYNSGQNGSGGNGLMSDPITLISPPVAPRISVVANDNTANANSSSNTVNLNARITNSNGYSWQSGDNCTTSEFAKNNNTTVNQVVDWGSTTCYTAQSYNAAGFSPKSPPITANQKPGPFSIGATTLTSRSKYVNKLEYDGVTSSNENGNFQSNWGASSGADSGYSMRLFIKDALGSSTIAGTTDRTIATGGTSASINNVTPGVIYQFDVTAKAANGLTRPASASKIVQTAPDIPRSGHVWIVCNNKADGWQWMNYAYDANGKPLYGAADRTSRIQFASNNQTALTTSLNGNLAIGNSTAQTNTDTSTGLVTQGFRLTNILDLRAGASGNTNSPTIQAYGTYHKLSLGADGKWHDVGGNTGPYNSFVDCGNGGWKEPSNPCYGRDMSNGMPANCGMGNGRPWWQAS